MKRRTAGFTIVELLIVIVVIGILAVIAIVAYVGVQAKANDSAVQSNLRNFSTLVMQYSATNGRYPPGGLTGGPGGITISLARNSYATNVHNFIYCVNETAGADDFIVVAQSKSGKKFGYSPGKGMHDYTGNWGGVIDVCTNAGFSSNFSYGYRSDGTWWPWTQ